MVSIQPFASCKFIVSVYNGTVLFNQHFCDTVEEADNLVNLAHAFGMRACWRTLTDQERNQI